jgi:hypothetical protein
MPVVVETAAGVRWVGRGCLCCGDARIVQAGRKFYGIRGGFCPSCGDLLETLTERGEVDDPEAVTMTRRLDDENLLPRGFERLDYRFVNGRRVPSGEHQLRRVRQFSWGVRVLAAADDGEPVPEPPSKPFGFLRGPIEVEVCEHCGEVLYLGTGERRRHLAARHSENAQ